VTVHAADQQRAMPQSTHGELDDQRRKTRMHVDDVGASLFQPGPQWFDQL
jgi:hypothetical protein